MPKWKLGCVAILFSIMLASCSEGYYGTPDAGAAVMQGTPKPHADHSCDNEDCGNVLVTEPEDYPSTDVSSPTPDHGTGSTHE